MNHDDVSQMWAAEDGTPPPGPMDPASIDELLAAAINNDDDPPTLDDLMAIQLDEFSGASGAGQLPNDPIPPSVVSLDAIYDDGVGQPQGALGVAINYQQV